MTQDANVTRTTIPSGPGLALSQIEVAGAGTRLTDLDLVTISTDNGGSSTNTFAGTTFDDQADPDGQVPYDTNPGIVTDDPFAGQNPNGVWTLLVFDDRT